MSSLPDLVEPAKSVLEKCLPDALENLAKYPFSFGMVLGAVASAFLTWLMMRFVGVGALGRACDEWKDIARLRAKEIATLKKQLKEKDSRIDELHAEIERSVKQKGASK